MTKLYGYPGGRYVGNDNKDDDGGVPAEQAVAFKEDTTPEEREYCTLDRNCWLYGVNVGFPAAAEMKHPLRKWFEEAMEDAPWNGIGKFLTKNPKEIEGTNDHSEPSVQASERSTSIYIAGSLCEIRGVPAARPNERLDVLASTAPTLGRDQPGSRESWFDEKPEKEPSNLGRGLEHGG